MTREEAAQEFAAAMGWAVAPYGCSIIFLKPSDKVNFALPTPDAPLHEHLAFVGRVIEGLGWHVPGGCGYWIDGSAQDGTEDENYSLTRHYHVRGCSCPRPDCGSQGIASDPSWAAMEAAIIEKTASE